MKLSTILVIIVAVLIALFTALNWGLISEPAELSFGFASAEMPLGVVLLAFMVLLALLLVIVIVYLLTSSLLEMRRHSREALANRELAEKAESSRFTELRAYLEAELGKQVAQNDAMNAGLLARIDHAEENMRLFVEQSGNTLAAYIAEMDDRLERAHAEHGLEPAPPVYGSGGRIGDQSVAFDPRADVQETGTD